MNIWVPSNIGIIGAADGRDVATTAAALVGDIIYIALVATEPDCHRRGYAEAVMRTAIDRAVAAFGPRRLWLHASDMGRPVYAAMGFETGGALPTYEFGT
jgi:GNAT superfamily N-acetyltransferase